MEQSTGDNTTGSQMLRKRQIGVRERERERGERGERGSESYRMNLAVWNNCKPSGVKF